LRWTAEEVPTVLQTSQHQDDEDPHVTAQEEIQHPQALADQQTSTKEIHIIPLEAQY
jgi:hypothetical protein